MVIHLLIQINPQNSLIFTHSQSHPHLLHHSLEHAAPDGCDNVPAQSGRGGFQRLRVPEPRLRLLLRSARSGARKILPGSLWLILYLKLILCNLQLPKTPESDGSTDNSGGGGGGGGVEDENKAGFAVFTHFSENPSINGNQKSGNSKPRKGGGSKSKAKQSKAKPKVQTSSGNIQPTIFGPRPNNPPVDDDDAWGSNVGDDGNVSRREMSFPVSVVGAIDIVIGAVGAIDIGAIGAVGAALTLPSFLLVIAALFLSSITSHPLPQSQPFLPHPSSSSSPPPLILFTFLPLQQLLFIQFIFFSSNWLFCATDLSCKTCQEYLPTPTFFPMSYIIL